MEHSDEKWEQLRGKEECKMGCAVWNRGVHWRGWRRAEWKRRASNLSWGAPKGGGGGIRSAEWDRGAPIYAEKHRLGMRSAILADECSKGVGNEWGMQYRSASRNWGIPIPGWGVQNGGAYRVWNGIEERQSSQRELRSAYPGGGALKVGELTAEWNRRALF